MNILQRLYPPKIKIETTLDKEQYEYNQDVIGNVVINSFEDLEVEEIRLMPFRFASTKVKMYTREGNTHFNSTTISGPLKITKNRQVVLHFMISLPYTSITNPYTEFKMARAQAHSF